MMRNGIRRERLMAIFFFGCLLMSYPLLTVFSLQTMVFGIPLLYFYIFSVWMGLILLVYTVIGRSAGDESPELSGVQPLLDPKE